MSKSQFCQVVFSLTQFWPSWSFINVNKTKLSQLWLSNLILIELVEDKVQYFFGWESWFLKNRPKIMSQALIGRGRELQLRKSYKLFQSGIQMFLVVVIRARLNNPFFSISCWPFSLMCLGNLHIFLTVLNKRRVVWVLTESKLQKQTSFFFSLRWIYAIIMMILVSWTTNFEVREAVRIKPRVLDLKRTFLAINVPQIKAIVHFQ